jgi:uncharacterized integral membrane protein
MKKLFTRTILSFGLLAMTVLISDLQAQTTVNFNFTGAAQFWTVPPCVTTINVVIAGAKGGGPNGGNGARLTANIPVTP